MLFVLGSSPLRSEVRLDMKQILIKTQKLKLKVEPNPSIFELDTCVTLQFGSQRKPN